MVLQPVHHRRVQREQHVPKRDARRTKRRQREGADQHECGQNRQDALRNHMNRLSPLSPAYSPAT